MIKEINPQDVLQAVTDGYKVVDVREINEIKELAYDIPNIIIMPLSELEERYTELSKDNQLIMACRSGGRSMSAANYLASKGYGNLANITGGILAWHASGLPTLSPSTNKNCAPGGGCC